MSKKELRKDVWTPYQITPWRREGDLLSREEYQIRLRRGQWAIRSVSVTASAKDLSEGTPIGDTQGSNIWRELWMSYNVKRLPKLVEEKEELPESLPSRSRAGKKDASPRQESRARG